MLQLKTEDRGRTWTSNQSESIGVVKTEGKGNVKKNLKSEVIERRIIGVSYSTDSNRVLERKVTVT